MTETVRGPHVGPDDNGAARGEGTRRLRVERIFTSPGRHPYDEVTWVHRDVVMTNWRDGSVNFEQRGVEFPDFWSQNAVNIVTTKYFRGALGTAQREWSLRQLIDRVIDTYVAEGWRRGYFVTPDDADVFDHELKHMLIHQVFSFNSPVWFNVGTKSPQQVSACQPYDSPVCTPSGPVPIGKLVEDDAVGAKVYDANGVTQIVATKANGVKDVVRLHTTAGFVLDVTTDHLVWRCTGDASGSFVEAGSLGPGDALSWQRTYSFGEGQIDPREIAEAALAGWLQSGGFLGEPEDARRSLTVEASTVTDAEHASVAALLDELRPQAQEAFVKRWGLGRRDKGAEVPPRLLTAPLPVVASYLRSLFQSHGFVSRGQTPPAVEVDTDSEQLARGIQALLARFGIFSCLGFERDRGPRRRGWWTIRIVATADRRAFADEVGFIDPVKIDELQRTLEFSGDSGATTESVEISRVEPMGPLAVYDIQTESGEYLSGGLRVHNCFILAVDDSMDSILEWYKEEGLIFKGGSGAGVNLSRIRSSKELLSSGGTASGPVSFMRGADASAGTIKSGGATRRAAKMVILDVDHPDIEEFIETKAREEEKVRALRDAGFDMDLGGRDIVSVQYQNANNSVRVSDEFMRAVEEGRQFALRGRLDGSVIETRDASSLFRKMAEAAWSCADPGIQYDDTINDWHTCPETGRITASNPCSEYLHLDNSSCNLASLNLLAFLHDDAFDVERFTRAVELVITAMDISICFADFPTQKIAETTRAYRQLGIGYANLGALLMATGHAYDSDGGRALAAGLSSLMTGTAYRRSAELAAVVGPYDGYARNAHAHKRVIRKHAAANDAVRSVGADDYAVLRAATSAWHDAAVLGEQFGYRNSQVSVLAPTGTIGLMMNCDTTGIEPDLALVKLKKLVGGASMQIVNTTVPRALERLGYPQEQVEAIVEFIKEHGHVVGAPGLRPEHYEVFDCAMGERAILPMGHVRMMAAVQPFVSGAISKTVNMPESASVEDVERIYFEGWKLGLKALAIYRDNCKVGQPLSDARKKSASEEPDRAVEYRPVRRRLPKKRPSQTVSFTVGGAEGYLTAGSYPGDGLGELFIKMSKQGSTLAGMMDAFSIAVSIGLQYGVPLEAFASKFLNMRFEPAGLTDDPDVRMAQSVMDYIFRRLALDFLPYDTRAAYGVFTAEERALAVSGESHGAPSGDEDIDVEALRSSAPIETVPPAEQVASGGGASTFAAPQTEVDAPLCFTCGVTMRPAGSCYVCEQCGSTSGCS